VRGACGFGFCKLRIGGFPWVASAGLPRVAFRPLRVWCVLCSLSLIVRGALLGVVGAAENGG
jgi:hypothetical protein